MDQRMLSRWHEVCERWQGGVGYRSLSEGERVWLNTRALIDSIENGGLISYFYNSYADTLSDCLDALDQLGAHDVAHQVRRVCALFHGGVPDSIKSRNDIINLWPDYNPQINATLEDVDDCLMPLMPDLERRLTNFLHDAGLAT